MGKLVLVIAVLITCLTVACASTLPGIEAYGEEEGIIVVASDEQEPHRRLNPDGNVVQVSCGCNIIRGSYQIGDNNVPFSRITTMRKACPKPCTGRRAHYQPANAGARIEPGVKRLGSRCTEPQSVCENHSSQLAPALRC
jgi:hypothetical protein